MWPDKISKRLAKEMALVLALLASHHPQEIVLPPLTVIPTSAWAF